MNARMAADAMDISVRDDTHFNGLKGMSLIILVNSPETGNFTQYPNVFPEYLFEDIFCNRMVAKVLNNVLGPNPELRFINGNTVPRRPCN